MMQDSKRVFMTLSATELAQIDLLIDQGIVHSRTEFIQRAIKQELLANRAIIQTVNAETFHGRSLETLVGNYTYTDEDINDRLRRKGASQLFIVGRLDLTQIRQEDNLFRAIKSLTVVGKLVASASIQAHYED
ncbi:hypothetical protein [Levilactobacillus wangkuiensis]|uniref:hypothetical protein n=1 Tax=Levilactobacillus wangkuiensis TaxID=2799566 RepID=UPI001940C879|nr:hypothetical protein [Levilactobacillus wangkuiensis]